MDESGITNAVQRHNEDNDGFTIVGGRKKRRNQLLAANQCPQATCCLHQDCFWTVPFFF